MREDSRICQACGARLPNGATVCDLCGTAVDEVEPSAADEALPADPIAAPVEATSTEAAAAPAATPALGVFCNQCGWKNPPGARFCSQCGAALQQLEATSFPPDDAAETAAVATPQVPASIMEAPAAAPEAEASGLGRQLLVVVGAGVLLVVVLFMWTVVSKELGQGPQATTAEQAAPPPLPRPEGPTLAPEIAAQATALENEIAALTGSARIAKQQELLSLHIQNGRYDLAGDVQKAIAEATGSEEAWILTGNLYYDWMESLPDTQRGYFAQQAIAGYQAALTLNPANLDVRTDMAIAYLYDPANPMQAIVETNRVLEQDSTHLQANFNRGIMLFQIGRLEQAEDQFQKVKVLVGDPGDPIYQRADAAIDAVQQAAAAVPPQGS